MKKYEFLEALKIKNIKVNPTFRENADKLIFNNLYCDTSRLKRNWLKKILIVGDMGAGKTEMCNWLAESVLSIYPKEAQVALVFANSLKYCLNHLPDADVVIIIVDDAIEYQSSQRFQSKENQLLAWKFYKIRHWYRHVTGRSNTLIITIFTTQRFKDLDPRFREAHIIIFKNVLITHEANKELKRLLNAENFNLLERATILRNFNLPEFGKYYAYFINERYVGFSEFPEPNFYFEKIDVSLTKDGTAAIDLMTQILFIRNYFYRKYKKDIKWEDLAKVVGWRGTAEGLRIKFKRWKEKNLPNYNDKLAELSKTKYYQPKKGKKPRNINKEIEEATGFKKQSKKTKKSNNQVVDVLIEAAEAGFTEKELSNLINPENSNDISDSKRKMLKILYDNGYSRKTLEEKLVQAFYIDNPEMKGVFPLDLAQTAAKKLVEEAIGEEKTS